MLVAVWCLICSVLFVVFTCVVCCVLFVVCCVLCVVWRVLCVVFAGRDLLVVGVFFRCSLVAVWCLLSRVV